MDEEDEPQGAILSPWTVKDMPRELTAKAVAYARRHQITVAQLVSEALTIRLDPHMPGRPQVIPKRPSLGFTELIALSKNDMPQWLRAPARRELGTLLGVEPPAPPKNRLPTPAKIGQAYPQPESEKT